MPWLEIWKGLGVGVNIFFMSQYVSNCGQKVDWCRFFDLVALHFHDSLNPWFLWSCFLTLNLGLIHGLFRPLGISDTSRNLKKFLYISAFPFSIPDTAIRTYLASSNGGNERHVAKNQVVLSEPTVDQTIPVDLPADYTCLKVPRQNELNLAQINRTIQPACRLTRNNDHYVYVCMLTQKRQIDTDSTRDRIYLPS